MKVLVYGGNGWIGSMVTQELLRQNIEHRVGVSRCENIKDLVKEIDSYEPTHIFSLIGRTHGKGFTTIDYLEQKGKIDENVRDNLFSPLSLAILCSQRNIHFTYLGTGCIFEYDEIHTVTENPFVEDDLPNFKGSSYSVVKGYTDQILHLFPSTLNLRIRMPITSYHHPRNFITKISSYSKVCSIPNSMTVLDDFIPIFIDMMKNKVTGTVNCTNPGLIEHNEILEMYRDIVDPSFKWENFSLEEQDKILASKRSNNYLNTKKIESMYPNILSIKDSIRESLNKMRKK